jgi:hypothetical protein
MSYSPYEYIYCLMNEIIKNVKNGTYTKRDYSNLIGCYYAFNIDTKIRCFVQLQTLEKVSALSENKVVYELIRCKDSLPEITKEYFRITRFLNHINMLIFDSAYDSMIARLVDEITNDIDKEVVDSLVKLAKESPV